MMSRNSYNCMTREIEGDREAERQRETEGDRETDGNRARQKAQ